MRGQAGVLGRSTTLLRWHLFCLLCAVQAGVSAAPEEPGEAAGDRAVAVEEIVVVADLDSLPGDVRRSLFGFEKSILETPRSASSVSEEMMDRFNIRDIDELIALAPGSFTQSFFGVAGSLDIRGTTGETYFRGIRRLDNPGNYPTPIGASARIDIVRGPASPIHGPAKIGGYLDFTPKSARIEETGEFIDAPTGTVSVDLGSWRQRVASAEAGGPGRLAGEDFGYWLYAEVERSDSYYRATQTDNTLAQASFDMDLVDGLALQFGGMVHDFAGNENAGWNRLTQELIDHGSYVTGQPKPLDADGDGRISHQEFDVDGDGFTDLNPFAAGLVPGTDAKLEAGPFPGSCAIGETLVFGCHADLLALETSGRATLKGSQVMVAPEDGLHNQVGTAYFDIIASRGAWEWRNQTFFEIYENRNEVAYGFSQRHRSSVVENKLVAARSFEAGEARAAVQLSPSLRHTRFRFGNDYSNEYFDRRDLTLPASALDRRLLATQIDADYTEYYIGDYTDLGLAALLDGAWRRLDVLLGARYDRIRLHSRQPAEKLLLPSARHFCADASCVVGEAEDTVAGVSWTASVGYRGRLGLHPYATLSRQATVIAGQGAEVTTANIAAGQAFDISELREIGLKGSLFDDSLYFALAAYAQERTDYSAQNAVTNQASRSKGAEFELRWAVSERLLLTLGYSHIEVVNLNTLQAGGRFSFIGADDVPGIAPEALYGGALVGTVVRPGRRGARRAGVPEDIWSFTGTYRFGNGLAMTANVVDVDAAHAGFSNSVLLPAYTLVNLGVVFETGRWTFAATAKNVTDERYFRANFPNLFGGVVVLPEQPRHFGARAEYRW